MFNKIFYIAMSIIVLLAVELHAADKKVEYKLLYDRTSFMEVKEEVPSKGVLGNGTTEKPFKALKGSHFYFDKVGEGTGSYHTVSFTKVKKAGDDFVAKEKQYRILATNLSEDLGQFRETIWLSHGLLTVPFKIRTDDGSISPSTNLGYYIGMKKNDRRSSIVFPLISFGLVTVSTVDVNATDPSTKMGITAAIGGSYRFLKDNFQVGLVGGIDHLGGAAGDAWKYEDDFWWSLSLGFDFSKPATTR